MRIAAPEIVLGILFLENFFYGRCHLGSRREGWSPQPGCTSALFALARARCLWRDLEIASKGFMSGWVIHALCG